MFVSYNTVDPCRWHSRLSLRDTGSFPGSGQRLDAHQLLHFHALQCPRCSNVKDREHLLCFGISWGEAWWNTYVLFIYFMFYVWEELSGFFFFLYWGKRGWFCSFHWKYRFSKWQMALLLSIVRGFLSLLKQKKCIMDFIRCALKSCSMARLFDRKQKAKYCFLWPAHVTHHMHEECGLFCKMNFVFFKKGTDLQGWCTLLNIMKCQSNFSLQGTSMQEKKKARLI